MLDPYLRKEATEWLTAWTQIVGSKTIRTPTTERIIRHGKHAPQIFFQEITSEENQCYMPYSTTAGKIFKRYTELNQIRKQIGHQSFSYLMGEYYALIPKLLPEQKSRELFAYYNPIILQFSQDASEYYKNFPHWKPSVSEFEKVLQALAHAEKKLQNLFKNLAQLEEETLSQAFIILSNDPGIQKRFGETSHYPLQDIFLTYMMHSQAHVDEQLLFGVLDRELPQKRFSLGCKQWWCYRTILAEKPTVNSFQELYLDASKRLFRQLYYGY